MDLNILLDNNDRRHLYVQIYEYIRNEIRSGSIAAGERLPSTRALGEKLHVARTTVELAYEQLEDEGYIESRRGSGAYVCEIGNIPDLSGISTEEHRQPEGRRGTGVSAGYLHTAGGEDTGLSRKNCREMNGQPAPGRGGNVIDFSPRAIDMSEFPYPTWRRIMRGILSGDRSDLFGRGDPQGDPELRETIARYLHLSRGCHCSPDQIVIGAGNDYLMLLLAMVLGEGKRVGMESPTYSRMGKIWNSAHETVVPIPCDGSGMRADALQAAGCDLAYVMPARQYPMGIPMPFSRRAQLLQWAAGIDRSGQGKDAEERFIIEDDYDSEFKYRGHPLPALQSQDTDDRVIYSGTFSKTIAPAIRVSYMILPQRLQRRFRERGGVMSCTVPRLDQAFLNEFIRDGHFERYLNKMRNRYRAKHDLMVELLSGSRLMEHFELEGQGAGLHLLLALRDPEQWGSKHISGWHSEESNRKTKAVSGEDSEAAVRTAENIRIENALEQRALSAGVRVHPMTHLYLESGLPDGQVTAPTMMLGYAALTEEEMKRGIALLEKAWTGT